MAEVMPEKLVTVREAAQLKGVSRTAVYAAVQEGRLPHVLVLGRIGVPREDVVSWEPVAYGKRSGSPGRGGRRPGIPASEETKAKIAASQTARWAATKQNTDETVLKAYLEEN